MKEIKINSPWVLLDVSNIVYAISCESVLSLSQLQTINPIPTLPVQVRGVIEFRDRLIQLVDTRTLLGFKKMEDEINDFNELMEQRYKDHENWVKTLEDSVLRDTEFTLTTDPHKCAFGKWYDAYKPKSANIMFLSTFAKFDEPHKAIHKIGITVKQLMEKGKKQEAIDLVNSVKDNELKQMIHLFEELKKAYSYSRKEIVMVIGTDEKNCIGLSVDQIVAIEHLFEIDEKLIKDQITETEYLEGLGKRKDGSVVFLLNDDYILKKFK